LTEVRKLAWVAGISAVIALLASWTFAIEWEWTYYSDDEGHVLRGREALKNGGATGLISASVQPFTEALSGRFKPLIWSFTTLAYQLGPNVLRGLAMLSLLVSFGALMKIVWQQNGRGLRSNYLIWVAALFLSNYTLLYGLWVTSLQELWGVTLVAIATIRRGEVWRFAWLLGASLMKEPFTFVLLVFAIYLFFEKKKTLALLALAISSFEILLVARGSQSDDYVQGTFQISPWHFWSNFQFLGQIGALFLLVALIGLVIFQYKLIFSKNSLLFISAGFVYGASLLAWNTNGYYSSPVWYLISVGLAFACVSEVQPSSKNRALMAQTRDFKISRLVLLSCLLASALLAAETIRTHVLGWNQMVVEARDWFLKERPEGSDLVMGNINPADFNFILTEQEPENRTFVGAYSEKSSGFVLVMNDWSYPPEIDECPPIKVWTKGFLAPLKC
jgi:hypothetical protein